jgi:hypothetical protein
VRAGIAPGAVVWLVLAGGFVGWLAVLALTSWARVGVRAVVRWLLGSWLPRLALLAAWGAAGWHVFCQRP